MFQLDLKSRTPLYEQIRLQIMQYIRLGVYPPNSQLPSIREVARELTLNVNTVKRAFQELEKAGVIYTVVGRGSFVSENAFGNSQIQEQAKEELRLALKKCVSCGVDTNEAMEILKTLYQRESEEK